MNKSSLYEACREMTPKSVNDVIQVWGLRPGPEVEYTYTHYKWHDHLIHHLDTNRNYRSYNWYYDRIGQVGKSRIARYLSGKFPNRIRCIRDWGDEGKFATLIMNELASGWSGEILIVDIARTKKVGVSLYACIEALSDGMMNTTRYQGRSITIPVMPKVFVFANVLPNVKCGSADRWSDVYHILDKDQHPKQLSIEEIFNQRESDWNDRDELPEGAATNPIGSTRQANISLIEEMLPSISVATSAAAVAPFNPGAILGMSNSTQLS